MHLKEVLEVSLVALIALVVAWNVPAIKQAVFNQ